MKRRSFLSATTTALGAAMTTCSFGRNVFQKDNDVSYEPNEELKAHGLSISDGIRILKEGETGNTRPVLREEILDNPNAVFFIYPGFEVSQTWGRSWPPCNEEFERFGRRVSELVFRKGTETEGKTFIKPNMVGVPREAGRSWNTAGIVHPNFTVGLVDGLRDIGNSNVAISTRGATRHEHLAANGMLDLFNEHKLPLIEAHVQYFKDYKRSELQYFDNPEALVQRRIYVYRPVFEKDTTFINIAHAHTHKVGYTTLCLKNLQGVMPRGYGHTCDSWTHLDKWRRDIMKHFNRDYRRNIEKSYVRHAQMGYKYWDEGGFYKAYRAAGGYDEYKKNPEIADPRIMWAEIWAQRMVDNAEVLPKPYVNMVEGVFGRGSNGIQRSNFLTVGRNMVAVDAVSTWLMGHDPREVPYLRIANERGMGENNIDKIPIFMLSEKGIERLSDYHLLKRSKLGIYIYGIDDNGYRYL